MTDVPTELLRLRERQEKLSVEVIGHGHDLKNLATGLGELRDDLRRVEDQVEGMSRAEEIADHVTAALRQDRQRYLNGWRRTGAALLALILAAPAAHDLFRWINLAGWIHLPPTL